MKTNGNNYFGGWDSNCIRTSGEWVTTRVGPGGAAASHIDWKPVMLQLAENFIVYAMDRRGRGESGDADTYTVEREFEDVAAVVDLISEPVHLLRHSFGAICALEAALHTDNLHAFVLYEPLFSVKDAEFYSKDMFAEMKALFDDGENERALILLFEEIAELPPAEMNKLRSAPNWPSRVVAAHTVLHDSRPESESEFDPIRFTAVTAPVLLLSGSESPQSLEVNDCGNSYPVAWRKGIGVHDEDTLVRRHVELDAMTGGTNGIDNHT